jgi:hypothetical protein
MSLIEAPKCQHVRINGTRYGSPALRRGRFCFFHNHAHKQKTRIQASKVEQQRLRLPVLEDSSAIQLALMQVMEMLAAGRIENKTAYTMLYALQTASANLRVLILHIMDARGEKRGEEDDSLAKLLLRKLGIPTDPVGSEECERAMQARNKAENEEDGERESSGHAFEPREGERGM